MKKGFLHFFSLIILFSQFALPQGESALPSLLIPVSPEQAAMGGAGTSIPTDDVFGFLYNPAHLGYTSRFNNFSFITYPGKIDWFGSELVSLSSFALNAGYNFKHLIGFPLSVGFGFAHPEVSFGEFVLTGETSPDIIGVFESKDYYSAFSLGAGIDYYIQLYAGVTLKQITSELGRVITVNGIKGTAEVNTADYGFLLNIPVLKLMDKNFAFDIFRNTSANPYLNLSIGSVFSNVGGEVYYVDEAQKDPLPRTARLGYGITTGLDLQKLNLNLFNIHFSVDAQDILINSSEGSFSYQGGFGDIDFGNNILKIKGDEKVSIHRGLSFGLLETLVLRTGHHARLGVYKTNGFEIRIKGLLKLLSDNPVLKYAANHFDIRYCNSTYYSGELYETKYNGIAVIISGYDF